MKKIVHVVEAFGGGIYSFLTELCNAITNEYEVTIIYSLRKETPKFFEKDFNTRIKFVKIDMCRGLNPYKNIKSFFQLKKNLKEEKADIIHLHSSKAGFLGRIASYMNKFNMNKVFYNPHGFSFLQQNESKIKRNLFYFLEKFAAKLGGCIVGCSKGEYEEALKISNKCIKIDNGIDTGKIDKIIMENNLDKDAYKNNKKLTIGTVGRICYQKNPVLFNEIAKSFPQYDFVWIGYGELNNELTSENIKITGWINRQEVIAEVLKLNIFIMTSLWEGLPISLLEAMYLERSVIVSNVIGNRDVIQNGSNGYVAEDLMSYYKSINNFAVNGKIREVLKKEAAENVVNQYSKSNMIKEYEKLYLNQ